MAGPHAKQVVPASSGVAVTTSDSTVLTATRALYIGVTGDLSLVGVDGVTYLLINVPVGILPVSVTKVRATGTDATDIVALY